VSNCRDLRRTSQPLIRVKIVGWFARLAACFSYVLASSFLAALPVRAQFPAEGAVPDPYNRATATGEYPSPKHDGDKVQYVFYFDCGKRKWIGVAATMSKGTQTSVPQAVGSAHEFPPGPPTGSSLDAKDANRAINRITGQSFTLHKGNWIDAKTGELVKSPKLCSTVEGVPERLPVSKTTEKNPASEGSQPTPDGSGLPPSGPPPRTEAKPDHLPASPNYIKH